MFQIDLQHGCSHMAQPSTLKEMHKLGASSAGTRPTTPGGSEVAVTLS